MGETTTSYCIPLFFALLTIAGADGEAVEGKTETPKTTSDIPSPATPKMVNLPAGLVHAIEDFKVVQDLGQEMARTKGMPQEYIDAALSNELQMILSYHMVGWDDAYHILKKEHETRKLDGHSREPSVLDLL